MSISAHRDLRVKVEADHWPAWTDEWRWAPTIAGHLADIPVGRATTINGRVVARWEEDLYEVVTYGRRLMDRDTTLLMVEDRREDRYA